MRTLDHARQRARETRAAVGAQSDNLLDRLRVWIEEHYQIELIPVPAIVIDEGRAEISPAERSLNYDERLERRPADLLWVLAHELGHLVLHARLTRHDLPDDPLLGSYFLNDGASALSRYSRRAREEAEANVFANEFISPTRDVFEEWRDDANATSYSIARQRGVPEQIVRVQLAEALYRLMLAPDADDRAETVSEQKTRKAFDCDSSQLEAATFTGAPALVTAGPGTGKTATLVRRIEFLLGEHGAKPQQFLVLTFSNDAAEELRERIAARFGDAVAAEMEIATFHGFGMSFLHTHALDLDPDITILDETGQQELITEMLGSLHCPNIINLRDPEETVKRLQRHINYLKDRVIDDQPITPELLAAELERWQPTEEEVGENRKASELLEVFHAYEAAKTARPAVDFADLIALPIRVLASRPQLVAGIREKYRWVLVDEYQDVSRTVAILLQHLCGAGNPPWVVGDMRQAIYRFRGAAPENVLRFTDEFPGARVFELQKNYRSCPEVVHAANQLAALMEAGDGNDTEAAANRWHAATDIGGIGAQVIALARAGSDSAEYDGIAAQVRAWLEMGVAPKDIAVLARRNVDVRNIVLALGGRRIKATTSGLMTPEGAAGDLAAVITFADRPEASLPRIVFSLGRDRYDTALLNEVIAHLLKAFDEQKEFPGSLVNEAIDPLLNEIRRLYDSLKGEFYSGDAFGLMSNFLFNGSDYLRRILDSRDVAKRALTLSEVITSLSRAAGYRFTHPDLSPIESRIAFAQHFRGSLNSSTPIVEAPRSEAAAVRVMTCHASKGLEFPCVIVAGQTLSQMREEMWLPPSLQPSPLDEKAQADALLFVGVTRAKRALVVTCAESKSGTERAVTRAVTPLLESWQSAHELPAVSWKANLLEREKVAIDAVWGGALRGRLAAATLDEGNCSVRAYLEDFIGVRFPDSLRSLYPSFFVALRLAMQKVVEQAQETNQQVSENEAVAIFAESFSESEFAEHPHYLLYRETGALYITRFARAYIPRSGAGEFIDPALLVEETDSRLLPLRFDLVAAFRCADGTSHAITFRPESLAKAAAKNRPGELLWSGLKPAQRMAFLLLKDRLPELEPWVFSAADGVLYKFLWNQRPANMTAEAERANDRWRALTSRRFETKLNERACDRCPTRIACPHWIGAV
ncbi:MAG TPA: UvrD-helicase domain-containing protein [Blastocatellia bacterium]|nr:UvrD-helicase domain-containing protein [Blastocatellia bacterium]